MASPNTAMAEKKSPKVPAQLLSKMSLTVSSKKKRRQQQQQRNKAPSSSTSSESESSPANSPFIPRRRHSFHCNESVAAASPAENGSSAVEVLSEVDGVFISDKKKKRLSLFGSSHQSLFNPKSVQHLLEMLELPCYWAQLTPLPGEDGPLHSLVCQPRPDREKVALLITMLTRGGGVDINYKGKDAMTPLHYAVQANDLVTVRVLLSFGADVNVVNSHQHTPLDIATLLWLAHEKGNKISRRTNKLETVHEGQVRVSSMSFPNINPWSPAPSPLLQRTKKNFYTRMGSDSSWDYVEEGQSPSSSETEVGGRETAGNGQESLEDSRDLTSTILPIKVNEIKEEALDAIYSSGDEDPGVIKSISTILDLLYSLHAQSGKSLLFKFRSKLPLLLSLSESSEFQNSMEAARPPTASPFLENSEIEKSVKIEDFLDGKTIFSLYEELEFNIAKVKEGESSINPDLAFALVCQERELVQFRKTGKMGIGFDIKGGSRLLFLDGGGIKGLVQIEVLRQLEEATGRKVTQLFDWIVGSSIGAILALGLVYGNKTLKDLQQMMFRLKDDVFANPRAGFAFNTKALEKRIMEEFDPNMRMCDVKKPKVLIAAVNKTYAPPVLHFFNNCFDDNFSQALVWKVARYTSAAPIFFTEFEGYVDGGVLANNPCEYGLTAIQKFHRKHQVNLPISMVVSVGTGIYPPEELGRIDAQEFLFFGMHWFSFSDNVKKRAQNLLTLLTNALLESEIVAKSCGIRCLEQNIPYYRFSPQLTHVIGAGETDNDKLLEMMWQTRVQTPQQGMAELVAMFQLVADASRKEKYRQSRIA